MSRHFSSICELNLVNLLSCTWAQLKLVFDFITSLHCFQSSRYFLRIFNVPQFTSFHLLHSQSQIQPPLIILIDIPPWISTYLYDTMHKTTYGNNIVLLCIKKCIFVSNSFWQKLIKCIHHNLNGVHKSQTDVPSRYHIRFMQTLLTHSDLVLSYGVRHYY